MYELKPCPFCGGKAKFEQLSCGCSSSDSMLLRFKITCRKCNATAPNSVGTVNVNLSMDGSLNVWQDDRNYLAAEWNKRSGV